jgi:hypothetical protein
LLPLVICRQKELKGEHKMEAKKLAIINRISLLKSRPTENKNIIRKLERELRALQND